MVRYGTGLFDLGGAQRFVWTPRKKEDQKIKGAGCGKDTQIIPACEDARSALLSRDSVFALFVVLPPLRYRR